MPGEGGVPGRRRLAVAWVMMRSSAGRALTSDWLAAFVSCLAVRNWVQIIWKSESRGSSCA